jgi:hypothetical protein
VVDDFVKLGVGTCLNVWIRKHGEEPPTECSGCRLPGAVKMK